MTLISDACKRHFGDLHLQLHRPIKAWFYLSDLTKSSRTHSIKLSSSGLYSFVSFIDVSWRFPYLCWLHRVWHSHHVRQASLRCNQHPAWVHLQTFCWQRQDSLSSLCAQSCVISCWIGSEDQCNCLTDLLWKCRRTEGTCGSLREYHLLWQNYF